MKLSADTNQSSRREQKGAMPLRDAGCDSATAPYRAAALHQRGFTMVEAIIVIIITGIIGAAVAIFIRMPVQGYVDSVARAELTDVADTSLRRIARDLRLALPHSVRVSADGKYMELLLTKTGGRYLAAEDYPLAAGANVLNFMDATKKTFDVVGAMPLAPQNIVAGDFIVVYNIGVAPGDAYDCTVPCNRAQVAGIAGNAITLAANPFATQVPPMKSPTRRFQVVTAPVTYFCDGTNTGGTGVLRRYSGYTIQKAQPISAATLNLGASASNALIATKVESCIFSGTTLANIQSDLVGLTISLQDLSSNAGRVILSHQVHVDNTP